MILEILVFVLLFVFIIGVSLFAHWFDKKHNLQLVQWLNLEVSSPFRNVGGSSSTVTEEQYNHLKERVEILEKLVTDPATELNAKINKL